MSIKRINYCVAFMTLALYFSMDIHSTDKISSDRLNVAVIAKSSDLYASALKELTKLDYLNVVERRDMQPLLHELQLSQQGVVENFPAQKFQNAEFLVLLEPANDKLSARIVRVQDAQVIAATTGSLEQVVGAITSSLDLQAALKQLALLSNSPENFPVKIFGKYPKYKVGNKFTFSLSSDADGYLNLITVTNDGDIEALIPNEILKNFPVNKGEEYDFPSVLGTSATLTVGPPAGRIVLKAIITKQPLDILKSNLLVGKGSKSVRRGSQAKFTRGLRLRISGIKRADWGVAEYDFQVVE